MLKSLGINKLSIVLFLIAILVFSFEFSKPNITSREDVFSIEGTLLDYSFEQYYEWKNKKTEYYFRLVEYPCTFQISADFEPFFYKSGFENEIKIGEKILVAIPLIDQVKLQNPNVKIKVFSIKKNSTTYLNLDDSIKVYNSPMLIILGFIALIISLISFFMKKKRQKLVD